MATGEAMTAHTVAAPHAEETAGPAEWRRFLERAGARFEGERVIGYNDAGLSPDCAVSADGMADLSHFGLISVSGPDAGKFLASLFPGDVRLVSAAQAQFTGWCDAKGRMLATFWLFMCGEAYYLLLPMELLSSTLTRLRQFRLRSRVSIADASGTLMRVGLSGPQLAAKLTEAVAGPLPVCRGETRAFGDWVLVAIGTTPVPRWLAIGPAESLQALWGSLEARVQPVGDRAWALLDILGGIPLLIPETSGEFIPQMLDLEALGGLCFTKGCYPGQEVVARLQYRGQLKRRLYRAFLDGDRLPAPGAKLYRSGPSESIGTVVSSAFVGPRRIALLAVIVIEHQERGDIRLGGLDGPSLEFPPEDSRGERPDALEAGLMLKEIS